MKSEVLVKTKMENPDILLQRRHLAQSKSVGELSQIHSLSDFPLPSGIKRVLSRNSNREGGLGIDSKG